MDLFFQQLLNGLSTGSIYSQVALGLTMVFGVLHIPNFAHGAFYMIGAYVTLTVMTIFGVHYWIATHGRGDSESPQGKERLPHWEELRRRADLCGLPMWRRWKTAKWC